MDKVVKTLKGRVLKIYVQLGAQTKIGSSQTPESYLMLWFNDEYGPKKIVLVQPVC